MGQNTHNLLVLATLSINPSFSVLLFFHKNMDLRSPNWVRHDKCTWSSHLQEREFLACFRPFRLSIILSRIYELFGALFSGLNNVAVYQNGQISGMSKKKCSHLQLIKHRIQWQGSDQTSFIREWAHSQ